MNYRTLGRTGLKVSEIALGCEGFVLAPDALAQEMFQIAKNAGVNCMDLYSPNPDLHRKVGQTIKDCREDFVLQAHLCTIWKDGQYKATRDIDEVRLGFETMLKNLGTDYIDVGMIHYVDSVTLWDSIEKGPIMEYARELKAEGRIRFIGVSSHNPDAALKAVESGLVDVIMFSVNPCYDLQPADEDLEKLWADEAYENDLLNMDPQRERLYETCQRLGVGITVMKAFGGGDLLTDESPAGVALTVNQCLHYALTRPAVSCVMAGSRSPEELKIALDYETATDAERDYASAFATFPRIRWEGHCMYCGHCAPCTSGIDIAMVTKFLNLSKSQGGVPETVREHYAALEHKAGDCIECASCESRCPFHVNIVENMREAQNVFGK